MKLPIGWKPPGRVQGKARSLLERSPKWLFGHPVWGIVVATLLALTGRSELMLHSIGLTLVVLWLSLGLWAWLLKKKALWHWRFTVGCGLTGVMLIMAMIVMFWSLNGKLADQRANVFQNLNFSYTGGVDPMDTIFTMTNNSAYAISEIHPMICYARTAVGNNVVIIEGAEQFWHNGKWNMVFPGSIPPPFSLTKYASDGTKIEPGGDAESEQCLGFFRFQAGTACADVTIGFFYTLEDQANIDQEKDIRYFVHRDRDGYKWIQEPTSAKRTDFCSGYLPGYLQRGPTQPRNH